MAPIKPFIIFLIILGLIGCFNEIESKQEKNNQPPLTTGIKSPAGEKNPKPRAESKQVNQVPEPETTTLSFPKLKLTEEWLKQHPTFNLAGARPGQLISILGMLDGKTFIADSNSVVHEIETSLAGDYSHYLNIFPPADKKRIADFFSENSESIPLPSTESTKSLKIPPFSSYTGPIDVSDNPSLEIMFNGFVLSCRPKWEKQELSIDLKGDTWAVFSIPCRIKIGAYSTGAKINRLYLQGAEGKKYYAPEKEITAAFLTAQFLGRREISFKIKIKAPADDFTLMFWWDREDKSYHPIWINGFLEFGGYMINESLMESLYIYQLKDWKQRYLNYLPYASSKRGYNRILAKICSIQILLKEYRETLQIIDRLSGEIPRKFLDEDTANFFYRQKITVLLKLGLLKSAIIELCKRDDGNAQKIPSYYQNYLIKNVLLQVEKQEAMDLAAANPQNSTSREKVELLKKKSWNEFLEKIVITPFITEGLIGLIKKPLTTQEMYHQAREFYIWEKYLPAKSLLLDILASKPGDIVGVPSRMTENKVDRYKAGVGAADMLVRIYRNEKNKPEAMKYAQRMIDDYFYDVFYGPYEGEGFYGGPGGAEGLLYQMDILAGMIFSDVTPDNPDYVTAIKLAHDLIKKFDGVYQPCWEFCPHYEESAGYFIIKCLGNKNAPLSEWKKEIRAIVSETKNKLLQADLLLLLGKKSVDSGDKPYAIRIYNEVFENYDETYGGEFSGSEPYRIFFIDAFEELVKIYMDKPEVEKLRQRLAVKCKAIRAILDKDEVYELYRSGSRYYTQYLKNCN